MVGLQEGADLADRQGRNGIGFVLVTGFRAETDNLLATLHRLAEPGFTIDPAQMQYITGVDPVRIGNLRIDVPETGPEPGFGKILAGDIPQGVAFLHYITFGVTRFQPELIGQCCLTHGHQQAGEDGLLQIHNTPCYFCTQSVAVFCRRK